MAKLQQKPKTAPALPQITIKNLKVHNLTLPEAIDAASFFIASQTPHQVITLNAEMAYLAFKDASYAQVINNAHLVLPDGSGILWAAKKMGTPLKEKVAGIDFVLSLAAKAAQNNWTIFLYGGKQGVASEAKDVLAKKYPGLKIVGASHGYLNQKEEKELILKLKALRPHILFVALGAPKQDFWIYEHQKELKVPLTVGVGGSFDIISGRIPRAPQTWQKLNLEWLYRTLKEPRRLKRTLRLPLFVSSIYFKK